MHIARSTYIAAAAALLIAIAAAVLITNLNRSIAEQEAIADQLQTDLTAEQGTTAALRMDLAAEQQAKADVEDELAGTKADLTAEQDTAADLRTDLSEEQQARADVEDELATTEADLTAEQETTAGLRTDLSEEQQARADVEDELADTQADLTAEQRRANAAESRANTAAAELRTLQQTIGSLESIQTEIRRLEEERRPLILDTYAYSPTCTGSMEPVITCLDSVTMLDNIDLDDLVVGAVVGVDLADGTGVLHRIIDMKDGMLLPKGDNSDEDDGWVPLSNVDEYLIGIEKNVDLGDAWIRERVNSAHAEYTTTRAEYHRLAERHCGGLDKVDPCRTSQSNFRKVLNAWEDHQTAYCRFAYLLEQADPSLWDPREPSCTDRYESAANSWRITHGPVSDHLLHQDDDGIEVHYAGMTLSDFEASVLLANPWPEATGDWDYGLFFRHSERNNFHAVVLTSDGRWSHRLRTGTSTTTTVDSGRIDHWNLNNDEYFFTQLRLVVRGKSGWLYINGHPHATLYLGEGPASGDVGVITGFFSGNEIEGQQTPFNEFVIYDISSAVEIPAAP